MPIRKKKPTSKIIIENRTELSMIDILGYIAAVIELGRISNYGKQYCYATRFKKGIMVYTDLNKRSDRFIVCREDD